MTKLLLIGVAAATIAVVGSANAADMALKAPPIVPIVYPWTGCYIGGNGGIATGTKIFQDVPPGHLIDPQSPFGQSVTDGIFGGIGGGQVGCDYQFSPNFVVGFQGNFDAADISGSVNDPLYTGLSRTLELNAKTDSLFGAVGRVGYTPGSGLLWYVEGGAAWVHDSYSPLGGTTIDVPAVTYTSASETRLGGVVGAGFEMFVTPNITVFAQYDHYFFGTTTVPFTCNIGGCGGTQFVNITQDLNTWRVGANWRFVWWPH